MTDNPTTGWVRLRDQETGTNLSTWGENTDSNLAIIDNGLTKLETYVVSLTTQTVTLTDYAVTNYFNAANTKLTGNSGDGTFTLGSTITMPSVRGSWTIYNQTGSAVIFQTSTGTSVTIPYRTNARIASDGTNFYNRSPNFLTDYISTLTNAGDIVVKTTLETAIANAVIPAAAGTVLISAADTTAGYLGAKINAFGTMADSTGSSGGNETADIKPAIYTAGGTNTYTITPAPAYTAYATTMVFYVLFTNANTGAATLEPNGLGSAKALTKNGSVALSTGDIAAGEIKLVAYDGTRFQMLPASAPTLGLSTGAVISATGTTAAVNTRHQVNKATSYTITLPASPAAGDVCWFDMYGAAGLTTFGLNSLKYYGSTVNPATSGQGSQAFIYTVAATGWIDL